MCCELTILLPPTGTLDPEPHPHGIFAVSGGWEAQLVQSTECLAMLLLLLLLLLRRRQRR
jgi:MYXO-CTERM domain-containing protein